MIKKYKLFTTQMCPNCPEIKEFMKTVDLEGDQIDAATPEGLKEASACNVASVPTVIFLDENDKVVNSAHTIDDIKKIMENKSLADL